MGANHIYMSLLLVVSGYKFASAIQLLHCMQCSTIFPSQQVYRYFILLYYTYYQNRQIPVGFNPIHGSAKLRSAPGLGIQSFQLQCATSSTMVPCVWKPVLPLAEWGSGSFPTMGYRSVGQTTLLTHMQ